MYKRLAFFIGETDARFRDVLGGVNEPSEKQNGECFVRVKSTGFRLAPHVARGKNV